MALGFVGSGSLLGGRRLGSQSGANLCRSPERRSVWFESTPRRAGCTHRALPVCLSKKTEVADSVEKADKGKYVRQLIGWVAVAAATAAGVYALEGSSRAEEFIAGYIVEQSLSVDNLFVFLLIFNYFKVPMTSQEKVLNWGIYGAIVFRGIMIVTGEELISMFDFMSLILGGLLFYSSAKILFGGNNEDEDLENNSIVKISKRLFKTVDYYDGDKFFTRVKGGVERLATPLLVCMLVVELSDVVFALDSVPAVLGISRDAKVIYLSNILAICGLRSLYFILESLIGSLRYLPQSLAAVLAFVGAKLCLGYWHIEIDTTVSLAIVLSTLGVGVAASLLNPEDPEDPKPEAS
mmetsp:Transcript_110/g.324  ORF Transcript_110/g.324 Transcript_110/m.324 type:complete len:351 (+) Transcript_110:87-1139(+)|eukprot:CAMPEP_0198722292 /NCGR_PEP_ID=MMETSP1475-20131203/73_1 /TAXON_ID= ORGANISM="Unidentified sp., Strain CCMP1999" /NCGR_SAMPLE_ID=MMETSP1475 /ASSEMBLY_ACC=CAM_ASM_001111 /LENGTH=350 /DNA_ID=CAMNT_0044483195 /DNA_START=43 /DNA_END=1095 /DNA_ORIENTATION=+